METISISEGYIGSSHTHDVSLASIISGDFIDKGSLSRVATYEKDNPSFFNDAGAECQKTKPREHTDVVVDERQLFALYVEQWREERGITSSISDMVVCPSYLKIIALGEKALPMLLAQIEREGDDPDHWFAALEAITGQDPVPEDAYGDTVKMAKAWLLWAEKKHAWW